jgi:hypothetical protein
VLQKFLFVGVGGSGGVTLRALRNLLSKYLVERGYFGGMPSAWQFVHVDVPLEQDRRPERIPLLNASDYAGLAVEGLPYRDIDRMMCGHGGLPMLQHTTGWRPHPNEVNVAPETGGGRYRAVGRVVLGARMSVAYEVLRNAVQALDGESTNTEFSRLCLQLTGNGEVSDLPAQVVVVSSLAGGSGSGLVNDVCDLLRQLKPDVEARLVSILYTPEVFDELAPADREGINPNALGALCELLNARWNREPPTSDEFAFLKSAGASVGGNVPRRGPRIPYLIGRSNGSITYENQGDVYEAVARGLAMWTTSPEIQARFSSYEIGNWADRATNKPDETGLIGTNFELPLSSFGCASIGIGRDRFAMYAADRLTREAVEHLLSGHWRQGDEWKQNEEEARKARVNVACAAFLAACKLDEKGPHSNNIIDAVRGGVSDEAARTAISSRYKHVLLDRVREAWPSNARAEVVGRRVIERADSRWQSDFSEVRSEYLGNAAEWAANLQGEIQRHTAELMANEGARVAFDVLQAAITELTETVIPELIQSRDSQRRLVGEMKTRVRASLANVAVAMPQNHPGITKAVDAALDSFHSATEELVYELSIELIKDLCKNLLTPLRDSIDRARELLQLEYRGTAVRPSPVPGWPVDGPVPTSYFPAKNELVLDDISDYPHIFVKQICAQVAESSPGNALTRARSEVITGIRQRRLVEQTVISAKARWVPSDSRLRQSDMASPAAFTVDIDLEALSHRTRHWIRRPDTPMSRYLDQTLVAYLADANGSGEEQAERQEEFRNKLAQAIALSRPLIAIDAPKLSKIHGGKQNGYREVMTPLPFPEGHPGRSAAASVFARLNAADFERLFGDTPQQRIDIFTFLDQPVQPHVMSSFTSPIAAQWARDKVRRSMAGFWTWRRAKGLPWFVPCTPEIRRDMVRGWIVARILNHVRSVDDDLLGGELEIWSPQGGYQPFPFPLLGQPINHPADVLPAVMESLALTIIGESFAPYERLKTLGQSVDDGYGKARRSELIRWIKLGKTEPGAPTPEPKPAGTADGSVEDRMKCVIKALDTYQSQAESHIALRLTADSSLEVPRIWELRNDMLAAATTVRQAVEGIQVAEAEEVW